MSILRNAGLPLLALLGALTAAPGVALAQAPAVDGTRDAGYPAALAVQTNETSFGNSTNGTAFNANGSELDNIHAQIVGTDLYIFVGGNLETNFNKLDLFFDTKSGGQNVLSNNGTNYVGAMNNLQFDAGFAADYALEMTTGNATATTAEVKIRRKESELVRIIRLGYAVSHAADRMQHINAELFPQAADEHLDGV